ncbi:MAG: hypothetical protein Q8930_14730 [Bacillota bacterium]|nr:hypothetical protein [Bacillota bacterium]
MAMRIETLNEEAVEKIQYRNIMPDGRIAGAWLPVLIREVEGLPESLDGIIIASDLQESTRKGEAFPDLLRVSPLGQGIGRPEKWQPGPEC